MKNIEKRKKNEYCEKSNKINKYIFTFTFSCGKKYILLENIFEKKNFFCYICITIFSRGRLLEMQ